MNLTKTRNNGVKWEAEKTTNTQCKNNEDGIWRTLKDVAWKQVGLAQVSAMECVCFKI